MGMKASTREAVEELLEAIAQDAMELILLFCAPHYDVPAVLAEIAARAPGVRVLGCTTAGEITPIGYRQGTITGLSLSAERFAASVRLIEPTSTFKIPAWSAAAKALLLEHAQAHRRLGAPRTFALQLGRQPGRERECK